MFTGLIEHTGIITAKSKRNSSVKVCVKSRALNKCKVGQSVAVNGVCLTVTQVSKDIIRFDVINETLRATTIGLWAAGQKVNLETAAKFGQTMDGHLVQGHVDAPGQVVQIRKSSGEWQVTVRVPSSIKMFAIKKGSIAIDGVSLTIQKVTGSLITVALIPHTRKVTSFSELAVGDKVNVEVDQIGKMVYHWVQEYRPKRRKR